MHTTRDTAEVLLVEDDPHDVELTLRALRSAKVERRIEVARDGEEALDYLFRRGAHKDRPADQSPILVLLDLKLPKVGGLQVLREVKASAECAFIPVVVLTSSGEQRDIADSYRLGVNGYIQKPVNIDEFRKAIEALTLYCLRLNLSPASPNQRSTPVTDFHE
jgi:two-component system response regulator